MSTFELSGGAKTLRQRLNEGGISVQDALSYAALLAEALRAIHDDGRAHGAVTPNAIALTAAGLELLQPEPGTRITCYTAPEVAAEHKAADARSDIFSFAAVLFEMPTERKAFEGDDEAALVVAPHGAPAPNSGNPPVDRLLAGCFAKDRRRAGSAYRNPARVEAAYRRSAPRGNAIHDARLRSHCPAGIRYGPARGNRTDRIPHERPIGCPGALESRTCSSRSMRPSPRFVAR